MSNDTDLAEIIRLAQQVQKALTPTPPPVDDGMPVMTKAPSFGPGPYAVGNPITRASGEYVNATPVAGQRRRDGVLIPGATSATYTLTAEDAGKALTFEELVVQNTSKKQQWFTSPAIRPVAPPPVPAPPPSAALESAIADMKGRNDFVLRGYEPRPDGGFTSGWYVSSDNGMGAHPVIDATATATWSIFYNRANYWGQKCYAALPWAVIFDGVNDQSHNTGVELFDMVAFVKSKATRKWNQLAAVAAALSGTNYGKPDTGLPDEEQTRLPAAGVEGRIIVPPADRRRFWHGWGEKGPINPDDVAAVFVRVKARLVTLPGKPDDRDLAQLGLQVGNDYYLNMNQRYDVGYAPSACIARTRKITKEVQTFTCCTLTDVGNQNPGKTGITVAEFLAEPPPM